MPADGSKEGLAKKSLSTKCGQGEGRPGEPATTRSVYKTLNLVGVALGCGVTKITKRFGGG